MLRVAVLDKAAEDLTMTTRNPPTGQASDPEKPFRDPEHWKTGDEPMTAAQKSYLSTLATEAGESISEDEPLTKAEAALRIEELQKKTGRGQA